MKKTSLITIIWGVILIVIGVGFLLNSFNIINFNQFIGAYWPSILILIGLVELLQGRWSGAILWGGLGIIFQLSELHIITSNAWGIIWPIVIIWIGASILIRSNARAKIKSETDDFTSSTGIFGGDEKKIQSKNFKGASISAVFGGSKLDLRNVELDNAGAIIDVMVMFGGGELIVPKNVPIIVESIAIFGGIEDKRSEVKLAEAGKPSIRIQGTILFGGLEIKD